MKLKPYDLILIAFFAALIALCAWITIPAAVPFTMQTFGLFLALLLLGGRRGVLCVTVYLLLGAAGAPVFSGFRGGVSSLAGVTGGYLAGFLVSALLMWALSGFARKGRATLAVSMVLSLAACYAFGTAWFVAVSARAGAAASFRTALTVCVLPYLLPDAAKLYLAFLLARRLKRFMKPFLGGSRPERISLMQKQIFFSRLASARRSLQSKSIHR